jgi:hypothetical protein
MAPRGIVDTDYLSRTGETLELGSELSVGPDDLEFYPKMVSHIGSELINEAGRSRLTTEANLTSHRASFIIISASRLGGDRLRQGP